MPTAPIRIPRRRFLQFLGAYGVVMSGVLPALGALGCKTGKGDSGDEKEEDEVIYFAVITDTHVHFDAEQVNNQTLSEIVQILNGFEVPLDFVVMTGDLVDDMPSDDPKWYESHSDTSVDALKAIIQGFTMPVHVAMGNHDYFTNAGGLEMVLTTDPVAREALFQARLDMPGPYYRFDWKGFAFYVLNSMQPDARAKWTPGDCGSFGEEQLAWLESQLADEVPCFLFFHHPLALDNAVEAGFASIGPFEVPRAEGGYSKYEGSEYEGWTDPIYAMLDARASQVLGVFVGHGHWYVQDTWAGIPVMETDSTGNSYQMTEKDKRPMRYHIVALNLTQGNYTIYNADWFAYNA